MHDTYFLLISVIVLATIFDFINGFHDTANAIATSVSTRVLSPKVAVSMAAVLNMVGALSGTAVAKTVGVGLVESYSITQITVISALISAIVWDIITWYFGLPTSSSHAVLSSIVGAAIATAGTSVIIQKGVYKVLLGLIISPVIGIILGFFLMVFLIWLFRRSAPSLVSTLFGRLQILSAAYMAFSHGSNDAQKTMGIIAGALFIVPEYREYVSDAAGKLFIPFWIVLMAHAAIGLGTLSGGWRIVHTMGGRLTRLKPRSGFCAETAAAISILFATELHLPVSTTHVTAGAITGVGSIQRLKAVRWGVATNILWAWVLTIPASGIVGWGSMYVFNLFFRG